MISEKNLPARDKRAQLINGCVIAEYFALSLFFSGEITAMHVFAKHPTFDEIVMPFVASQI